VPSAGVMDELEDPSSQVPCRELEVSGMRDHRLQAFVHQWSYLDVRLRGASITRVPVFGELSVS
jgi:hypothetical protein